MVRDDGRPSGLVEHVPGAGELDAVGELLGQRGDVALRVDGAAAGVEGAQSERRQLRGQVLGRDELVRNTGGARTVP